MRKIFIVVVFFLGVIVVALSFGELETTLETLQRARLRYFLLAMLIQMLWFIAIGWMYQSIFHLLGMHEGVLTLSRIATAANFINVVAPTAGAGGVALFSAEARRRGHPTGKATVAAALFLLLDQAAFLVILALGLFILFRRNHLEAGEISASLFLFLIASCYAFVLYLGYRSAEKLGNLLAKVARGINRFVKFFGRDGYLSEERAHEFAREISDGFSGLTEKPSGLLRPILWGIFGKILLMLILICSFLSFGVPFSMDTIVAGFSMAYLFLIVSPTPSGIGVVEGLMPLALASLNVRWSQAVVITLVYRTITFWFPFGIGVWAFRSLHAGERFPQIKNDKP